MFECSVTPGQMRAYCSFDLTWCDTNMKYSSLPAHIFPLLPKHPHRLASSGAADSYLKHLLQDGHRLIWILHRVSSRSGIIVDLVVVSTLEGLITEEMNMLVVESTESLLGFNMSEAVGLVPACWEHIEGDLAAY